MSQQTRALPLLRNDHERNGQVTEPWAILRDHPHAPEVPQHQLLHVSCGVPETGLSLINPQLREPIGGFCSRILKEPPAGAARRTRVLADDKHPRRRAARATPRTGEMGHVHNDRRPALIVRHHLSSRSMSHPGLAAPAPRASARCRNSRSADTSVTYLVASAVTAMSLS